MTCLPARGLCAVALTAAALAATAAPSPAPAAPPERRDPTVADAPVPALQHRSALQRYRRHAEQPLADWRAANDEVTRIGGWRTYLREAHAPDAPDATDATDVPQPSAAAVAPAATLPASPAASAPAVRPAPGHGHGHHHGPQGGRR